MAMLTPNRLQRLFIEVIFLLLGGLVMWLGWTGHIFFNRRSLPWLVLSVVLILWGLFAVYKPAKWWARGEAWNRGLSLALLGGLMLGIANAPFTWVGYLLAICGIVLVVRGVAGSYLLLKQR